ncbi:esterase family protein [Rhodopirellula sp. SWK7]|uniref:esterase family protein n=1 Tax=Rhodopirellula sp. SWK7 TaxID=595460 RepID=UPI00156511E0|nr:alpha/beta hydrolase-fold protein [Rhodopirellula sp. SWK7]
MTKRLLALLFLCHVCSPFAGSADEVSVIQPIDGAAYDGELSSAEHSQSIRIDLSPGDFVRGSVRGEEITVWLLGRNQSKLRRLASGIGAVQGFMFVAGDRGPYSFEVSGQRGTGYKLQLDSVLALADQTPIAEEVASPKLRELRKRLDVGDDISELWSEIKSRGTPLIETSNVKPSLAEDEALVTFLWRGAKRNVRIFGAPSGDHDELKRLGDSDIWYHSYRVPNTARINYRLAPDVPEFPGTPTQRRRAILATAQRDPLNPLHEPDEPVDDYEGFSIVELPDAPKEVWSTEYPSHPKGTIETHRLTSDILGNTRDIHVYRSAGYEPNDPERALVVTFDGDQYRDEVRGPVILDNLVAAGKIPPTAAIMISNPSQKSRSTELPCNDDFARFIGEELMPWAKTQHVTASRERTVVAGASFGGLCSVFVGLKHPELFGNVFSQSGSLWWAPGGFETKGETESQWLTRQYVSAPSQPVRYYLQAGTFEKPSEILQCTKHLRDVLQARGYDVTYGEFVGGHGYFYWRHSFADGIMHLLQ